MRVADPLLHWLAGGQLPRHDFVPPLDILRMYAQARRAAMGAGHAVPELPFPRTVRASLFNRTASRDMDVALGRQERRAEAARLYAARARELGEGGELGGHDEAAEDGREEL
eukprot:2330557-Alexandrium_andersonii.AAC.1